MAMKILLAIILLCFTWNLFASTNPLIWGECRQGKVHAFVQIHEGGSIFESRLDLFCGTPV
jgi:hypothetical protein